jgi:hypothetical protein
MKTTLKIGRALLAEAKGMAKRQRTSLTRLIEEGLRLRLRSRPPVDSKPVRLPVYRGKGGLVAGLDGSSNRSLLGAASACADRHRHVDGVLPARGTTPR